MNPSQARRNALGGVQVRRLNVDLSPAPGALSRIIQINDLGAMPKGGHTVTDRQGVLDAIGSQTLLRQKGGYVQLPAQLPSSAVPAFMQMVDPVLNGQYSTQLNSRAGNQTFAWRRNQTELGLRNRQEIASFPGQTDLDVLASPETGGYQSARYEFDYEPTGYETRNFQTNTTGEKPIVVETGYRSDPSLLQTRGVVQPDMVGYSSYATAPGVRDLYLSNDDWAEMGLSASGYAGTRQVDSEGNFTGRMKNTGRRDFNFGVAQGQTVGNSKGKVYSLQGVWPVENNQGEYKLESVASTLNQLAQNRVPYGETEAKMMAGDFVVSGNSEMTRDVYDINANRPRTWIDSPVSELDNINSNSNILVPVDTGDALYPTWNDTAYSKADQMTRDDMLSRGNTSEASVLGIGYRGAPTAGLSVAPLPNRDINYQPRDVARLAGPLGYGKLPPIRNYSESATLVPRNLVGLNRMPTAFQGPAVPIGGTDFTGLNPTSIDKRYSYINLPSTVYTDKGTSRFNFDPHPGLVEERLDANNRVMWDASQDENGVNGLNDYGNILNAPSLQDVESQTGYLMPTYKRDFANERMAPWQYNSRGRHIPAVYGEGRNESTTQTRQQKEKFRILEKADRLLALEKQMGMHPNIDLFDLVPRNQYLASPTTGVFDQVQNLHRASRQADMAFDNALQIEADIKGYTPDEVQRELIFRAMGPEAGAIARSETAAYAPTMTGFDNRLVNSFRQQQEMARRAAYGQFAYDETERRAINLPDVEPYRVTIGQATPDGSLKLTESVQNLDYRDMLAQRRTLAAQGYGQLQQRIPVQYGQEGSAYPVVEVGHQNMRGYPHTKEYKQTPSDQRFTENNQFYSIGPDGRRVMHGTATLPLTLGQNPSRADDFVADEAIRIQPAYQYGREDFQNTAGDRLRGEGYVPPAILDPIELARRNAGISYESTWQQRPYGTSSVGIGMMPMAFR